MTTFALVTEGPTDQIVIESILIGLFEDQEVEPVINRIQPPVKATGQAVFGGWELILQHFARGDHHQTMQFNDYLIVHLDTDIVQEPSFGLMYKPGEPPEALIQRVQAHLRQHLGSEFVERFGDKVIFAIAVDSVECWLLPLWESQPKKQAKTTGCLSAVNHALKQNKKDGLTRASGEKVPRSYERASAPYCKQKTLLEKHAANASLKVFVESVRARNLCLEP